MNANTHIHDRESSSGWPLNGHRPRVWIAGAGDRDHVRAEAEQLAPIIARHAELLFQDLDFSADLSRIDADFAIVLGGDGSILRTARQMGPRQVPVVGVNFGKLGFLAALSRDEFVEILPRLCDGKFDVVDHLMFSCKLMRDGKPLVDVLGLNEAAVLAGPPFSMLNVELYVDGELATTYSADGLIISTPVGSTAHSLSAGGPILRKSLQAFVISPISPHTLTVRPVVDTADRIYEMVVPSPNAGTSLVVDGRSLSLLEPRDRVRVERADSCFRMIEVPGHNYYRTLREKLGWSGAIRADVKAKQTDY